MLNLRFKKKILLLLLLLLLIEPLSKYKEYEFAKVFFQVLLKLNMNNFKPTSN
jgi:hypothetical protein